VTGWLSAKNHWQEWDIVIIASKHGGNKPPTRTSRAKYKKGFAALFLGGITLKQRQN
jgi:hypothetical protein